MTDVAREEPCAEGGIPPVVVVVVGWGCAYVIKEVRGVDTAHGTGPLPLDGGRHSGSLRAAAPCCACCAQDSSSLRIVTFARGRNHEMTI